MVRFLNINKSFVVIKPPLISIISKIEENISTKNKPAPIVNETILNKTQNNLKLKRLKPLNNTKNSFQTLMDLKII